MIGNWIGRCRRYARLVVSDDSADRAILEHHADGCPRCRALMAQNARLADAARRWRDDSPEPPASLEAGIVAAVARELREPAAISVMPPRSTRAARGTPRRLAFRRAPVLATLAAGLVCIAATAVILRSGMVPGTRDDALARAIESADRAQHDYTVAIAELEAAARGVFAESREPGYDPRSAGILLAYRHRLEHLDSVIGEVTAFLDENPGHAGGHTVLLAAYKEKAEVLREVIAVRGGTTL